MEFLLELSFVMAVAEWVWLDDDAADVSPEMCMSGLPLMNTGCWSRLAVKGLGIAIIVGACLNKAPMIYNIWSSQSTTGLSAGALYGDLLVVANSAFYGYLLGYPFTAYGETLALCVQAVVIIGLQWKFAEPSVVTSEKIVASLLSVVYLIGIAYFLPADYYHLLMASTWPLQVYAKGSQIYETFRVRHTGAQAIATIGMNLTGSSLRILTTLKEVGWDMAFLTGSLLSVALNSVAVLQYVVYRKNTKEFLRGLEKKKVN
jgi:mannose-P-dolichol utilization defect protein 1